MLSTLQKNWWAVALRGLFAILFGVLTLIWPGITLLSLVMLFGAYALFDGVFAIVSGFRSTRTDRRWWVTVLEGVAGVLVGLATFFWPGITALVLLYFIAAWAVFTGVLEIIAAIQLRKEITGEWALIVSGALSVLFGLFLMAFPGAGALGLTWMIGGYAIAFGILLIVLAFRLRSLGGVPTGASSHLS